MGKWERDGKYPDIPIHKWAKSTGIRHNRYWEEVPEKIPELIVPDLSACHLKPYVSYGTKDIYQEGDSLEPSSDEAMGADEALERARQTGSDIFQGGEPYSKTFALKYKIGKA